MHFSKTTNVVPSNAHIVTHNYRILVESEFRCNWCGRKWIMKDRYFENGHKLYCPHCGDYAEAWEAV